MSVSLIKILPLFASFLYLKAGDSFHPREVKGLLAGCRHRNTRDNSFHLTPISTFSPLVPSNTISLTISPSRMSRPPSARPKTSAGRAGSAVRRPAAPAADAAPRPPSRAPPSRMGTAAPPSRAGPVMPPSRMGDRPPSGYVRPPTGSVNSFH